VPDALIAYPTPWVRPVALYLGLIAYLTVRITLRFESWGLPNGRLRFICIVHRIFRWRGSWLRLSIGYKPTQCNWGVAGGSLLNPIIRGERQDGHKLALEVHRIMGGGHTIPMGNFDLSCVVQVATNLSSCGAEPAMKPQSGEANLA